jgi:Niemann-Pick C1 protein
LDVTRRAATHPKKYIVSIISFAILVLVVGLLTNFQTEAEDDAVWTPMSSRPLTHRDWLEDSSGFPEAPRYFFLMVHTDGGNVLGREGVDRVFTALDTVRETDGYSNLCGSIEDEYGRSSCSITAVTTFWNQSSDALKQNEYDDEAAIAAMSSPYYPDGTEVDVPWILGNSEENEDGTLTFAQLYIARIDLPDVENLAEDFETVALDNVLDLKDAWETEPNNAFRLEVAAERSFEDEFSRAVVADLPLIPIVFIIMAVFTCIIFSKCDRVESRSLLGFGAVCCVLLSIMTGYGLMFIIGTYDGLKQLQIMNKHELLLAR